MKSSTVAEFVPAYSSQELITRIRAQDESAWRAVTMQYEPLLRSIARQCGLSAEDAGDAVQLTWQCCLQHIDQLTDADKLTGWLATICRRECVRLATKLRREMPLSPPEMARLIDDGCRACDPCAEAVLRDQFNRLCLAIMSLPARQRMILVELLRQEHRSNLDLSRRLGLPVGSIGPTLQRAVSRLRLDPRIADLLSETPDDHLQAQSA